MEVVRTSEGCNLHIRRGENLKCNILVLISIEIIFNTMCHNYSISKLHVLHLQHKVMRCME
jgi:hypothetical protein